MLISENQLREMIRESLGLPQDDRLRGIIAAKIDEFSKDQVKWYRLGVRDEIVKMINGSGDPDIMDAFYPGWKREHFQALLDGVDKKLILLR